MAPCKLSLATTWLRLLVAKTRFGRIRLGKSELRRAGFKKAPFMGLFFRLPSVVIHCARG